MAQMKRLGLPFQRIEAVTPETLKTPLDAPEWAQWERPMKDAEKALLCSHRLAWQTVRTENTLCLILEDDAYLSQRVPEFLQALQHLDGINYITLETRGRKKLVANTTHPTLPIRRILSGSQRVSGLCAVARRGTNTSDQICCHIRCHDICGLRPDRFSGGPGPGSSVRSMQRLRSGSAIQSKLYLENSKQN